MPSLVDRNKPHVVLADFVLTGVLAQIDALSTGCRSPRFLVLSVAEERASVLACARAGATGFVSKDAPVASLVQAIEAAARGEFAGSARVCGWLMAELRALSRHVTPAVTPEVLTARESEILQLMAQGLPNRQIAAQLGIELSTVKNHVHHILEKLNVRRRGEAVACLHRHQKSIRSA